MVRVRFAPSPTGNLHLGTLRTALFNWLFARNQNGVFVLRIEDTDLQRSDIQYETTIYEGLEWLGLTEDEGPNKGGEYGPYRQSDRIKAGIYQQYADKLCEENRAYPCFCTSEDLDKEREDADRNKRPYVYSKRCRHLSKEDVQKNLTNKIPYTCRFEMPAPRVFKLNDMIRGEISFDTSLLSDFVILKSDGSPSYNFAVVVDDALMEISHVIRGEDHISNTPRQVLLFEALGFNPPIFAHLPMILGADKSKLSKRHGATNVTDYREQGYLSQALFNFMTLLGWSPNSEQELFAIEELIAQFSLDRVSKAGAVFDRTKLTWMNGQYIRQLNNDTLFECLKDYLSEDITSKLSSVNASELMAMMASVKDNLDVLLDINTHLEVYTFTDEDYKERVSQFEFDEEQITLIQRGAELIQTLEESDQDAIKACLNDIANQTGSKKGKVFKTIRMAGTGMSSGPNLFDCLSILGKECLTKRLSWVPEKTV